MVVSGQPNDDLQVLDSVENITDKALAIQFLNEALVQIPTSNSLARGKCYLKLGQLYGHQHNLELGYKYYDRALKEGLDHGHDLLVGRGYLGKGSILLIKELQKPQQARYDSILYFYNESLPFLKLAGDTFNVEGLYANIALILANSDDADSAQLSMERILSDRLKREDKTGIIASLNNLGLVFRRKKDYKKSEEYYLESYKLASSDTLLMYMANAQLGIAKMLQEAQLYERGLKNFILYDSLNRLFLNREFQNKIAESETKLYTAEKERIISEKQQEILILVITITALSIFTVLGYLYVLQRRKILKANSEKTINDLLRNQEMKIAYALLEGQDQERKRVASELHDNLGNILVTLNMYADALLGNSQKERVHDLTKRISTTASLANEEVRKISHSLDSGLLNHFGLRAAINQLMEAIKDSKNIDITLSLEIDELFSNELSINAYRVIQELVNNTLKHSQCTSIYLKLDQTENHLNILFKDNGIGFDTHKVRKGIGLKNIENRAKKLGGTFKIIADSRGSMFIINLPLTIQGQKPHPKTLLTSSN